MPVNNQYLPRSVQERELCSRTVYAANIDKRLDKEHVQEFFEGLCGKFILIVIVPAAIVALFPKGLWQFMHLVICWQLSED